MLKVQESPRTPRRESLRRSPVTSPDGAFTRDPISAIILRTAKAQAVCSRLRTVETVSQPLTSLIYQFFHTMGITAFL